MVNIKRSYILKNLKTFAIVVAMVSMWSTSALANIRCENNGICGSGTHCRDGFCVDCGGTNQDPCDKGQSTVKKDKDQHQILKKLNN